MADSSPQLGYNFFCMREERIRIPRSELNFVFKHGYDLSGAFESRLCPASVLGHKNASLAKKSINSSNVYLMESDTEPDFHEKRCEVRGGLSDQGTEKGLGDDTILALRRFADYAHENPDTLFMYPLCLMFPGMLHVLYNALQEAILSEPSSADFLEY